MQPSPVSPLPSFYPLDTATVARIFFDHVLMEVLRQNAPAPVTAEPQGDTADV